MKKYLNFALLLAVFAISVGVVMAAKPDFTPPGQAKLSIPGSAAKVAPGVFSLGKAMNKGKVVEGYAFVHYKDKEKFGKPSGCNNDGVCQGWESSACGDCSGGGGEDPTEPDTSLCYGFLSKGAKWKTVEPWIVNPSPSIPASSSTPASHYLPANYVFENLNFDITKWEDVAGANILGSGSITMNTLVADTVQPDNYNEVYFANIAENDVIGVTIVWGVFGGPPKRRELVEWDMVFDDVDFDWSAVGDAFEMDFESIATHELGHAVGLDDLYDTACSDQTMYGYASLGETIKRTLEVGDIFGVWSLYK